ncbi:MAG: DUF805 domain-containing protein [Xanthobacteraceae bacterium]|nr:DUF805 domain-containing protein [Xanthobacteraceae bacterium]
MNWTYLLTSIEGRISRQPFWIAMLPLFALEMVAHYAIGERWSAIVSLILAYPEFALIAKRGHDRNAPTWIAGVFVGGLVLLGVLILLDAIGPLEDPHTWSYVIIAPQSVLFLILLVDFGFRRGTVGDNRYGPDPLGTTA